MLGSGFALAIVPIIVLLYFALELHKEQVRIKTEEITEANRLHLSTIEALATAIDARDRIGTGHVRRTQIYALGLGEAIGLNGSDLDVLRTGAMLHDVGKLAVPDHILSKQGQLTPSELEKAKTHAAVGASIIEQIDFPYPVADTVKYHHECWDGTGYPHGLKGDEIPVTSRVLAIADTYDALRSDRPYRPAHSRDIARQTIADGAGRNFDPTLVHAFLMNLPKFESMLDAEGVGYSARNDAENDEFGDERSGYVQQIKLANREVFTLFELTREFSESSTLEEMLSMFTSKVKELVPFDTCAIYLLDETRCFADAAHVEGKNKTVLMSKRIRSGEGASGFALKRREPVINANPDLDFSISQLELIQEYRTMVSMPMITDGVLIGTVSLYSGALNEYCEEHIRLLDTIARIAAGAISKFREHAQTKVDSLTDTMTGLPNVRSLQMQFEREMSRASRSNNSFQLLMMDLDGFKAVNDTFGHKIGDRLLREIGHTISEQLREYDFLARYGGDEFVALIPSTAGEDVGELRERIARAVTEFKLETHNGQFASVGVSIGAASYPENGTSFDQLVIAADRTMYSEKTTRKMTVAAAETDLIPIEIVVDSPPSLDAMLRSVRSDADHANNGGFVIELDESAVVESAAIN